MRNGDDSMEFVMMQSEEFTTYENELFEILYSNMNELSPTGNSKEEDHKIWLHYFRKSITTDTKVILILNDEELIGYFQYRIKEDTMYMDEIEIKKAYQHTGVFITLMHYVVNMQDTKNVRCAEAYVNKSNDSSNVVFTHWKFEIIGENSSGKSYLYRGDFLYLKQKYQ